MRVGMISLLLLASACAGIGPPSGSLWMIAAAAAWLWCACQCFVPVMEARPDAGATADSGADSCPPVPDGGHWEQCCVAERVTTCYCAPAAVCSFLVEGRPDGGCTAMPDGGDDRPEGYWYVACEPQRISTAHPLLGQVSTGLCPAPVICNFGYGLRTQYCADGACWLEAYPP